MKIKIVKYIHKIINIHIIEIITLIYIYLFLKGGISLQSSTVELSWVHLFVYNHLPIKKTKIYATHKCEGKGLCKIISILNCEENSCTLYFMSPTHNDKHTDVKTYFYYNSKSKTSLQF